MGAQVEAGKGTKLVVRGHGEIVYVGTSLDENLDHILLGTVENAGPAYLGSLRQALVRWRRKLEKERDFFSIGTEDPGEGRVWVGLLPLSEEDFNRERELERDSIWDDRLKVPPASPAIFLDGDRLKVRIAMWREAEPELAAVRSVLEPFLERNGASCEPAVAELPEHEDRGFTLTVDLDFARRREATAADVWKLGDEAEALLQAVEEEDHLPRSAALDLLCAGRWDLFHGQPETDWLEAKGAPYDHLLPKLGENWRFELAKDIAAFANSPGGGIVVLGMTTEDKGDGDVISGHKEFDLSRVRASVYRRHIAQLVYPRVRGFEVKRIRGRTKGKGLVVLVVPPQPATSRPFLVQGALSNGKVLGAHVLLPIRREDDTALMDAGAIHARLRLGEQVITGE